MRPSQPFVNHEATKEAQYRKLKREKTDFAEEREAAVSELKKRIADRKTKLAQARINAEDAGDLAMKELGLANMKKILPLLSQIADIVKANDEEQGQPRPGKTRHSLSLFLHPELGTDYVIRQLDQRIASGGGKS